MFWKKETVDWGSLRSVWYRTLRKKPKPDPVMFHLISRERRKWFRIHPSPLEPIVLRVDEKEMHIRDIGAAGLSFENDHFSLGPLESCHLVLPELAPAIPIRLQVVAIDDRNVCHCRFQTIEDGAVERIHQYVLRRQKEILRTRKGKEKKNTPGQVPSP